MSSCADQDLNSQQEHLSSASYDLRITNLARFINKKITNYEPVILSNAKNPEKYMDPSVSPQDDNALQEKQTKRSTARDVDTTFLDVGAGNGLFLKFFKAKGFKVAGYELEQKNIDNMKKDPVLKSVSIAQADITNLRGSENFDMVMASDVIEHIKDDVLAIKNLWSFVKPGGLMIITVPAHSYLYGKRDEKWGHHRRYDQKVLLERIEEAINTTPPSKGGELLKQKNLLLTKEESPKGEVVFVTFWNFVGFFVYGLFEKVLHKPINENMRYSNSLVNRTMRNILDKILRLEEMIGGLPLGLTLIVGVRKK